MLRAMDAEETVSPAMPVDTRERIARSLGAASQDMREI